MSKDVLLNIPFLCVTTQMYAPKMFLKVFCAALLEAQGKENLNG